MQRCRSLGWCDGGAFKKSLVIGAYIYILKIICIYANTATSTASTVINNADSVRSRSYYVRSSGDNNRNSKNENDGDDEATTSNNDPSSELPKSSSYLSSSILTGQQAASPTILSNALHALSNTLSPDSRTDEDYEVEGSYPLLSLPSIGVYTLGGITDLSNYLLLLSGSASSATPSFLSSFAFAHDYGNTGGSSSSSTRGISAGASPFGMMDRSLLVSYREFDVNRPFEMFLRRNSFIKVFIDFIVNNTMLGSSLVRRVRTVYLRNVGMEVFEIIDDDASSSSSNAIRGLFDEFWALILTFPAYVEDVYRDQVLHGFGATKSKKHADTLIHYGKADGSSSSRSNMHGSRYGRRLEGNNLLPNDPYLPGQWAHVDDNEWGIKTPKAWRYYTGEASGLESRNNGKSNNDMVVALIDSGADYTHPDIKDNIWVNSEEICDNGIDDDHNGLVDDCRGWDFFNGDNDPMDDNGHGTASAGIIGGLSNNNRGITGICWGCKIMVLKALNHQIKGTVIGFVRAIDYAIGAGARISNNSYGGRGSSFGGLEEAVRRAKDKGMLFVAAAGNYNGNNDNDSNPVYPASYDFDNVLSVGAITRSGDLAEFSSYGLLSVDITAPGKDILSTTVGGAYKSFDGTSFAVPFVSGAAALIWYREPYLTYKQVADRITNYAKFNPMLQGKIRTSGVLDVYSSMTKNGALLEIDLDKNDDKHLTCKQEHGLKCMKNAYCHTEPGVGAVCKCNNGYRLSGSECIDIDECGFEPCGEAAYCINLPGSFECKCKSGFIQRDQTCQDIDECSDNPCPFASRCLNFVGSYDCVCPKNSAWDGIKNGKCLTIKSPSSGVCVANGKCGINSLCEATGSWWFPEKNCRCLPNGYFHHPKHGECVREGLLENHYKFYITAVNAVLNGYSNDGSSSGGDGALGLTVAE